MRTAASCCLTDGAETSVCSCSNIGGDIMGPDRGGHQAAAVLAPAKEPVAGPSVCPARVRVADVRGEEFDVAPGSFVAEIGDQRRLARRCAPSRAINEAGEWNVLS